MQGDLKDLKTFSKALTTFIAEYPSIWKVHEETGSLVHSSGPLEKKTRHLIQLGMAAAAQLRGAIRSHAAQAYEAGATSEEIYQTVLLSLNTLGFPKMIMTYSLVKELIDRMRTE
jgi:AhpD family alkylhydroperoxidase